MPTPLPNSSSLDRQKRSTYLVIAGCLLVFGTVRLSTVLMLTPLDLLSMVLNAALLLLGVWTIWALRHGTLALRVIEQAALQVCVGVYLLFSLQLLLSNAQRAHNTGLSELVALALAAGVYAFLPLHRAGRWLALVLVGHLISQWTALLRHPSWPDLSSQLTRDLVVLATLLLIVLLGTHRTAWRQAYDTAKTMQNMAHTDDLTGLPNRRSAYRHFGEAMRDPQTPVSVLLVDIDNFKQVNDSHGHEAGDAALQAVAAAMQQALGKSGVLVRWGGEEFLALLSGRTLRYAVDEGEALRAAVEQLRLPSGPITVSVGVASRVKADTAQELVRRADMGLYRAKTSGKNQVVAQLS